MSRRTVRRRAVATFGGCPAGGGAATAAALIPRQAEDEHERGGARLRVVREAEVSPLG
ncbi:hypothetical protein [Amycolatopsis sp. WAC 01376]|uniref:hypothetical protein n=1 Tax=Amycolatopsis sp. WAC 01376 TaxID=2203195 RepID=UPI00131546C3|nr:hypothetical protein [Amycolatopsis sp. WAC 01376]